MPLILFASLPEDMRVLIEDFLESDELGPPSELPIELIAVDTIPVVPLDKFDRGTDHARAMDLTKTPPILIADGQFLDGKHRVFQARETGVEVLLAINLSGMVSEHMLRCNGMGPIAAATPVMR